MKCTLRNRYNMDHPIVALATPRYKSALAIIRICGNGCLELFDPFISSAHKKLSKWASNSTKFCRLIDPVSQKPLEEVMLCVFRTPHSFTGQDGLDISLHGSLISIDNLLNALYKNGFEVAEPGEFTRRAFINGKIDLTQAEAIHSLIESHTAHAHSLALEQLSGSIVGFINSIKHSLTKLVALCTVCLDYPDDEIQESTTIDVLDIQLLIEQVSNAIKSYDLSRIHREGAVVVLAGRTNSGKSTLFNALLKEDRAIVSNSHGTTRDFLESQLVLKDIPIRLYDTAGLRSTNQKIEQEGIQRSYTLLKSADIILYIIDASIGLEEEDYKQLEILTANNTNSFSNIIVLWNKIDLKSCVAVPDTIVLSNKSNTDIKIFSDNIIALSAHTHIYITQLQSTIYQKLHNNDGLLTNDVTLISSLRQKQLLENCRLSLEHVLEGLHTKQPLDMISLDINSALSSLGQITGEISNEDILDVVFRSFCVGK